MAPLVSDWEVAEREARLQHIASIFGRGATRKAIREEFPSATKNDIDTAYNRWKRGNRG